MRSLSAPILLSLGVKQVVGRGAEDEWGRRQVCEENVLQSAGIP